MKKIIDDWYDVYDATGKDGLPWQEIVNIDPAVKRGDVQPDSRYQTVRRLYRMVGHNKEFFVQQVKHRHVRIDTPWTGIGFLLSCDRIHVARNWFPYYWARLGLNYGGMFQAWIVIPESWQWDMDCDAVLCGMSKKVNCTSLCQTL